GMIAPNYRAGYGLFIRSNTLKKIKNKRSDLSHSIYIDSIPASDYKNNDNQFNMNIHIDNDFSELHYDYTNRYYGYEARFIKPYYDKLSKENKDKAINMIIKSYIPDADIISTKVLNGDLDSSSIKYPF